MKEDGRIVRRKPDTFRKTVSDVTAEYCSNSTIHGIAYLGADDKSLAEKIWWLIVFILSLMECGYLMADSWIKWQENPVILSFSQRQSSVWEIPFPAVTICPTNKVKKSVYNYTHAFLNYQTLTGPNKKHSIYTGHDKRSTGWSIEGGYTSNDNKDSYPDRASQDGVFSGLKLRLRSFVNEREYKCGTPASGFKVILHNPADMPPVSQQYILVPVNKQMAISVTPEMITTAEGLLNISPQDRNCFFAQEKHLYYFKEYTQKNCKIECIANLTTFLCHCLPFYFPMDSKTKICGFGDVKCFSVIKNLIVLYERKDTIYDQQKDSEQYRIFEQCDCLPSCAALEYSAETSQNDLYWAQSRLNTDTEYVNSSDKWLEVTQLDIFYKDTHFLSRHRSELFSQTDFLADCGGLLGLFMGISLSSLMEIVYYFTIRIWCRLKKKETKIINVTT
ncbi:pickpocket 26 [Carabus blaptoides fortunei]